MMIDLKPEVISDLRVLLDSLTNALHEHESEGPNPTTDLMYDVAESVDEDPLTFSSINVHTLQLAKNLKQKLHM